MRSSPCLFESSKTILSRTSTSGWVIGWAMMTTPHTLYSSRRKEVFRALVARVSRRYATYPSFSPRWFLILGRRMLEAVTTFSRLLYSFRCVQDTFCCSLKRLSVSSLHRLRESGESRSGSRALLAMD